MLHSASVSARSAGAGAASGRVRHRGRGAGAVRGCLRRAGAGCTGAPWRCVAPGTTFLELPGWTRGLYGSTGSVSAVLVGGAAAVVRDVPGPVLREGANEVWLLELQEPSPTAPAASATRLRRRRADEPRPTEAFRGGGERRAQPPPPDSRRPSGGRTVAAQPHRSRARGTARPAPTHPHPNDHSRTGTGAQPLQGAGMGHQPPLTRTHRATHPGSAQPLQGGRRSGYVGGEGRDLGVHPGYPGSAQPCPRRRSRPG